MTQDNKLVKKYDAIWNKDSNLIKKEFDSISAYLDEYLKTKIKL